MRRGKAVPLFLWNPERMTATAGRRCEPLPEENDDAVRTHRMRPNPNLCDTMRRTHAGGSVHCLPKNTKYRAICEKCLFLQTKKQKA